LDEALMSRTFYIVDVFGEGKYTGNQLAVFRNARSLATKQMQAIAREMNFAETTFILSDKARQGGYDVRIFTPTAELPFAGHPTLGTAFVIMEEIIRKRVKGVTLNLKVGRIPVTAVYRGQKLELLWMRQNAPTFGPELDPGKAASAVGLNRDDLDLRFPVEVVSTGIPFIIVPIKSRDAIKRCRVDLAEYGELTEGISSTGVFLFCPEPYGRENDFNARMFAPEYGVAEDPATGSANGCFAAYLVKHRYFGKSDIAARVEQGYEIGRPSLLHLAASERGGAIEVNVGGKTSMVAKGEFV
jgi:trans-2,3-dihydro-3-hydroxyanthranilate isomerase